MPDIADNANEVAEMFLENALRTKRAEVPPAGGRCLNCEAEIATHQRWCDADCRDDWLKRSGHAG